MNLPKFTAEVSLGKSTRNYQGKALYSSLSLSQEGMFKVVLPSQLLEGMEASEEGEEVDFMDEMDEEDVETIGGEVQLEEPVVDNGEVA
jgi:hypothetical protein